MDASLQIRAEQLAREIASQATTAEDLNGSIARWMSTLDAGDHWQAKTRQQLKRLKPTRYRLQVTDRNELPTDAMDVRKKRPRGIWENSR